MKIENGCFYITFVLLSRMVVKSLKIPKG